MLSADANDDDCNCNVDETEKPHCNVGHSNTLDWMDETGETQKKSISLT